MRESILLTGATGFVGAQVIEQLLTTTKYRVFAPIRSASKSEHLRTKYASQIASEDLVLHLIPYIAASRALDTVFIDNKPTHIILLASPFFVTTKDPVNDLVKPAVNLVHNILASAVEHGGSTLRRVVLLSSFGAVVDLNQHSRPGYVYTSEDWCPVTMEEAAKDGFLGYHASKTLAEKEAWKMQADAATNEASKVKFDLTTLCPPMIYGPPIQYSSATVRRSDGLEALNLSTTRLIQGVKGTQPAFAPKVATPRLPAWIDVRDVARACLASLEMPVGSNERILLCAGVDYYEDGMAPLRRKYQAVPGELGTEGARCNRSTHFDLDRSKMRDVLGLTETVPFETTLMDTYDYVKGLGLF